jgi:hypothetical protein
MLYLLSKDECIKKNTFPEEVAFRVLKKANTASYTASRCGTPYIVTLSRDLFLLTPCSRALLEKLTDLQLVKKFPIFYGTRRIITAFTEVRHLSLY